MSKAWACLAIPPDPVAILDPEAGGVTTASNHIELVRGSHQLLNCSSELSVQTHRSIKVFLLLKLVDL